MRQIIHYWKVEVSPNVVWIDVADKVPKTIHVDANVDGERHQYTIKVMKPYKQKEVGKGWFGKGVNQAFYHAKNQGERVKFLPVSTRKTKKKDVSKKQKSLF